LRLAAEQAPQIASQRALAEGARKGIVAAGALPDPRLTLKMENLPTTTYYRWTFRDYSTGIRYGFKQEFPWGEKLAYRTQLAQQEAERESVTIDVQRAAVQRDVATAWVARYFAEQGKRLLRADRGSPTCGFGWQCAVPSRHADATRTGRSAKGRGRSRKPPDGHCAAGEAGEDRAVALYRGRIRTSAG
jgi:hypothetical protein